MVFLSVLMIQVVIIMYISMFKTKKNIVSIGLLTILLIMIWNTTSFVMFSNGSGGIDLQIQIGSVKRLFIW